ncbi:PAS domain S-box-containing protein [Sporomusaceae bacterium BoRhaA]|uniref:sigma 54-interacting transcriptional regulator n=1 Tax=Pelorhabdus rhamnosifermentans TaxID=2772457 RepID=UPI001C061FCF|nr:sigma 54-interacting transcriptional regulator [Pelorhabdus rhamnosifermentans]MBU2700166.1 PAS domain S-box-containing protein [Pelorhabdus rhamnosifermentans]
MSHQCLYSTYSADQLAKTLHAGLWSMTIFKDYPIDSDHEAIWTDDFRSILGFHDETEFPNMLVSWTARMHPDDRKRIVETFTSYVLDDSEQNSFDLEYQLCMKNGEYRWFRTVGTMIRQEQELPLQFLGTLFDIHERKIKEQQAEFFLTRFDLISQALTEGPWDMEVVFADPINEQNKFWWSPQFRHVLGFKDEHDFPNIFSSWSNIIHPDDKETTLQAFLEHLNDYSGKTPYSIDYRLRKQNGEYHWFHATGATVRDEQGKPLRVAGTIRDIDYEKRQLEESQERLNRYCEIFHTERTFVSPQMKSMVKNIEKYSKVDAPILITGESGVGKEVVADLIHQLSDRKAYPFLKINCGAIPDALLESELFGYEEGAFSGAKRGGKMGFFELANHGTVLLDEIGDLPFQLQVKILRFVQKRDFYRLGGKNLIRVDCRIIAATNRNLETMVLNKEFRADLFYRLQVLAIHIPALRERPGDIIPLTQHFLQVFNDKYHMHKTLSEDSYRIFTQYLWKGNVRELENLMERLMITTDTNLITAECLPEVMKQTLAVNSAQGYRGILNYKEAKEQFERQYFQQAIAMYGSTRKVAEKIQLDHSTIVKKAAKYDIPLLHWERR